MGAHKFWTCFVEGTAGGYGHRHDTLESARQEAERLAKMPGNRGKKVYVLELVGFCQSQDIPVTWKSLLLITHKMLKESTGALCASCGKPLTVVDDIEELICLPCKQGEQPSAGRKLAEADLVKLRTALEKETLSEAFKAVEKANEELSMSYKERRLK